MTTGPGSGGVTGASASGALVVRPNPRSRVASANSRVCSGLTLGWGRGAGWKGIGFVLMVAPPRSGRLMILAGQAFNDFGKRRGDLALRLGVTVGVRRGRASGGDGVIGGAVDDF